MSDGFDLTLIAYSSPADLVLRHVQSGCIHAGCIFLFGSYFPCVIHFGIPVIIHGFSPISALHNLSDLYSILKIFMNKLSMTLLLRCSCSYERDYNKQTHSLLCYLENAVLFISNNYLLCTKALFYIFYPSATLLSILRNNDETVAPSDLK